MMMNKWVSSFIPRARLWLATASWACFWLADILGWFLKAEKMNNGVQEAIFIHFI